MVGVHPTYAQRCWPYVTKWGFGATYIRLFVPVRRTISYIHSLLCPLEDLMNVDSSSSLFSLCRPGTATSAISKAFFCRPLLPSFLSASAIRLPFQRVPRHLFPRPFRLEADTLHKASGFTDRLPKWLHLTPTCHCLPLC